MEEIQRTAPRRRRRHNCPWCKSHYSNRTCSTRAGLDRWICLDCKGVFYVDRTGSKSKAFQPLTDEEKAAIAQKRKRKTRAKGLNDTSKFEMKPDKPKPLYPKTVVGQEDLKTMLDRYLGYRRPVRGSDLD